MKSPLEQVATIAAGILLGAALLPLAPAIAIFLGSRMLGRALQERFKTPVAKVLYRVDDGRTIYPEDEPQAPRRQTSDEFLRQHAAGPASKYFQPPADESHRWN